MLYMKRFSKYMSFKIETLLIPLLQAISHIFEISEDDHILNIVGDRRPTLYLANAFVSPGVNSRGELVPSPWAYAHNGALRRWPGDDQIMQCMIE